MKSFNRQFTKSAKEATEGLFSIDLGVLGDLAVLSQLLNRRGKARQPYGDAEQEAACM